MILECRDSTGFKIRKKLSQLLKVKSLYILYNAICTDIKNYMSTGEKVSKDKLTCCELFIHLLRSELQFIKMAV